MFIELVVNMNPHQSWALKQNDDVMGISMRHNEDKLSGNSMEGLFSKLSSDAPGGHYQGSFATELGAFLKSYLQNGSQITNQTIDDFAKTMKEKYNINVTVYE